MIIPLLFFLVICTNGEEVFENSTNICQRCTCTISDDSQILTLDCINQKLQHMFATWPPHNTTIIATFSKNNITTLETLPPTDAVIEVVLSQCNIRVLDPGLFAGAKNTKVVDLSYNRLTAEEVTPEKFMGPHHESQMEPIALEHLNLAYNQIHTLNKDTFEWLPKLKRLNLEGNNFVVLDVHTQLALSSLTNLLSLNLANNELTELVKNAIESCTNLTELNLSKNELDFVPGSLFHVGRTLEILILDDNPIIELIGESFYGLEHLIELSANNLTKLSGINASAFATMPKLRKLSLSDNLMLKYIDREAFRINQTIEELYLNNNDLSRIDCGLLQWSKMQVFEFKENPLDCSCDLYNITVSLSLDITRNKNGPYCIDPRNDQAVQVYSLQSDICGAKTKSKGRHLMRYQHFSIPLISLIVVLITALFVAMALAYSRYRRFLKNRNYPFASQVLYNPVSTTNRF